MTTKVEPTVDKWERELILNGFIWKQWYEHGEDARHHDIFSLHYEDKWGFDHQTHLPRHVLMKMGARPVTKIDKLSTIDEVL